MLLLFFFQRLKEISYGTRANLYANLYVDFLQDPKLRTVSQNLKTIDKEKVAHYISDNKDAIFYYFDFMEFVVGLHEINTPALLSLSDSGNVFNPYINDLKSNPEIVSLIQENPQYPRLKRTITFSQDRNGSNRVHPISGFSG